MAVGDTFADVALINRKQSTAGADRLGQKGRGHIPLFPPSRNCSDRATNSLAVPQARLGSRRVIAAEIGTGMSRFATASHLIQ